MGWFLAFLAVLVALGLLRAGIGSIDALERENRLVESQMRTERTYREALDARVQEMRRFRHDVNGLLRAVEAAKAEGVEEEERRAGASDAEVAEDANDSLPLLTAIIAFKHNQCERVDIAFSCEIVEGFAERVAACALGETDLCAIVQNLLENAYEASLDVARDTGPLVALRLGAGEAEGLIIEVRNRIAASEMPSFETTKPNPDQHGIGMRIVEETARKHGGALVFVFDPLTRILTARVVIP